MSITTSQRQIWLTLAKLGCWLGLAAVMFSLTGWPISLADELSQNPQNTNIEEPNSLFSVSGQLFLNPNQPTYTEKTNLIKVSVTAYSSRVEETDDTPFITASNKWVKRGFIAHNSLPFGTKVRLPELFPDEIFVVEDRMNKIYDENHIDIWFEDTQDAIEFGVKETVLEIIAS